MSLLLVLNELSYRDVKARREEVDSSLRDFVSLLLRVRRHRTEVSLVTEKTLADLEFSDGYSIRRWAGDNRNRDHWRFLKVMRNRAPFREAVPDNLGYDADYFHDGRPADGLGTAHLVAGLAVSLRLGPEWEAARLVLTRQALGEDDSGEIVLDSSEVDVRHACTEGHVHEHRHWLVDSELTRLHTADQLWAAREDLFPHLRFLARVEGDLAGLPVGWFHAVKERLAELERSAADWRADPSVALRWHSKVTPESDSRRELCRFTDVDGVSHLFEWHARFTPGAGRLHFRIDNASHTLVVGYIGRKLGI
ncbi:hypothetical protein V6U90_14315 [Micromonospora sp. CPCC 206060]|uniref:hypothetical protein n=1 Tax=Micromonospora sp. CPCC 206060 TaxID=3122406 RepID=UPI002FF2EB50